MISRRYLRRQASALIKFAKSTNNPELAAALVVKAANLTSQVEERMPPRCQRAGAGCGTVDLSVQEEFEAASVGGRFFFPSISPAQPQLPAAGAGAACEMYLGGRYAASTGAARNRSGVPIAPRSWNQTAQLRFT